MKKTIALFMFVILSITLISGCSSEGRFNASNSNASSVSNSTTESQYNSPTSSDTHSDITSKDNNSSTSKTKKQNPTAKIPNKPKYISSKLIKKQIKKVNYLASSPKIKSLGIDNYGSLTLTKLAEANYKGYVEQNEVISLELRISNPERDTIIDVLLDDSQDGENCLYSSSSSKFKISSIDTLWDKVTSTYNTYVIISMPVCKAAGVRTIEIKEINFLRQIIDKRINGTAELSGNTLENNFGIVCVKADSVVKFNSVTSNADSITASLSVTDKDKSITGINVYLYKDDILVAKKEGVTDFSNIVFDKSLEPHTEYNIVISYAFDKQGNKGKETKNISSNIKTFFTGSGTETNPYQITTLQDWDIMMKENIKYKSFNIKYYKLMNDLDCNYADVIKDPERSVFYGVLDGNNKSINNLKITSPYNSESKLRQGYSLIEFNCGIIKNLKVKNIDIDVITKISSAGAGIAAYNSGTIQNCYADGKIHIKMSSEVNQHLNKITFGNISTPNDELAKEINCTSSIQIMK